MHRFFGKIKKKEIDWNSILYRLEWRDFVHVSINALAHANYLCEINSDHPTFIRKNSGKNYTEPHHLVPMAFSEQFNVSLDVEENIVSLCSNCHNQIHYGADADKLIEKLYEERKDALASVGIIITLEQLLSMYGY